MLTEQKLIYFSLLCVAASAVPLSAADIQIPSMPIARDTANASAVAVPMKRSVRTVRRTTLNRTINAMNLMEICYENISGFGIPKHEEELIIGKGGAPTYGEILYESLKIILDDLMITPRDVFYDFGSGVGKVCIQAYLDYPFKRVIGIELSEKRFDCAVKVMNELQRRGYLDQKRKLIFRQEDFATVNPTDATVIYMCSTCYSHELMLSLVKKFSRLKKGLVVISLKALPEYEEHGFNLLKEYKLPMTWSRDTGSPVHVYELTKKKLRKQRIKKQRVKKVKVNYVKTGK